MLIENRRKKEKSRNAQIVSMKKNDDKSNRDHANEKNTGFSVKLGNYDFTEKVE